jgi:hypothetical protein
MRSELVAGADLRALLVAIRSTSIVLRPMMGAAGSLIDWATARKSGNADAFVLAWIASHVRGARRLPRVLM